jgi:glycosyltransferase involved in cell wall biosynthesis
LKTLCLLWGPFGFRLDELAEAVGGERASLTLLYGQRYYAPLRYAALFFKTLILLFRTKPDIVYAQNPPIFCPFTGLLYCRIAGKKLLVDHHAVWRVKTLSGGFVGWGIGFLERFVTLSAFANTVPHSVWAGQLLQMGATRVEVIHDYVTKNPFSRDEGVRERYSAGKPLAIASHGGHPLELIETEIAAARMVPTLTLLITGPEEKLRGRLSRVALPANVRYLGLLPVNDYLRLQASSDFALNLTDEPYTLSHVLFEYAASSLPVVSSRQPVVEAVFGASILYADGPSPRRVAKELARLSGDPVLLRALRAKISTKYEELTEMRDAELVALRALVTDSETNMAK